MQGTAQGWFFFSNPSSLRDEVNLTQPFVLPEIGFFH